MATLRRLSSNASLLSKAPTGFVPGYITSGPARTSVCTDFRVRGRQNWVCDLAKCSV